MQTVFLPDVPDLGEAWTYVMCLNTSKPIAHWNITCTLKKKTCCFLDAGLKISQQNRIKSNQEDKWNSLKIITLLNRLKSLTFLYYRKLKFWIISYVEECLYADKICTDILLHIGNYNKLQTAIQHLKKTEAAVQRWS